MTTATHEFEILANDLDLGGKDFDFPVRAAWMRGVLEGADATASGADGKLSVRVSKSGTDIIIRGHLSAELEAPCARCLKPVDLPVDVDVTALMVPATKMKSPAKTASPDEEYEFTPDEADTLPYDGETVVLDDMVRDELVLEIPMIPLCSEDCPGMNPLPEEPKAAPDSRPVDPRLAVLKNFKPSH